MKVTVIVSEMDSQGMAPFTLHALCTQNYPSNLYEVIVPDLGNFTEEELAIIAQLKKNYPHLTILKVGSKNRAELFNIAAKQAKGELFCLIESHCYAHKNWIADYVKLHKEKKFELAVGRIRTVPTDSPVGHAQDEFFDEVRRRIKAENVEWSYFDCHNSAITKKLFQKLKGMDERLPNMCEFEIGARACELGVPILRVENSVVWHFNDNHLANYSKIVHWQGIDRTRMLLIHGKEFLNKYFPNPRFARMFPAIKRFRALFLLGALVFIFISRAGIIASRILKIEKTAAVFFMHHAENSVRYGMIKAAKERYK